MLPMMAAVALAGTVPAHAPEPPLVVRVGHLRGVPRLTVNGKPRLARIFWGQPGSRPIPVSAQGRLIVFEFTPNQSEPATATMHFRFGQQPGDVYLDDIHLTDLDTGGDVIPNRGFEGGDADFTREWFVWPPAPQNTVGQVHAEAGMGNGGSSGLAVHLKVPPGGVWPDFHIYHSANLSLAKGHRYRVSFWAKAEPGRDLTVAFYRPGDPYVYLGGPPGHFDSQIRLAAQAGVDLVSFEMPMPWPAPLQRGEPENWDAVDSICETVLHANPRALLIPRVGLYVPDWWKRAHPDELMRWEDGPHQGVASPASRLYRRDAAARLEALIRHVESRFGDHVAGYHPTGQNTGEWFYMDSWEHPLNGYAPCDAAAFRSWLRLRYPSVEALRRAWGDATADFETASVPSPAVRHGAPGGVFRNPQTERAIIDFVEFQQQSMADCVCDLARIVRRATQGRKLVLFFYGYVYEFGALLTGPGSSGHYALRRVLDCPDIDVLCSPISYFDRGPGQSAPCMTAAESVALAGKMWLNEDDTRTFLTKEANFPGAEHEVKSLAETNGELSRNVAQASLRNFATWWMDLPGSGWFDDPGIWAEMTRLRKLDEPMLAHPTPFHPEVAAVLDERGMCRVAEGGTVVTRPGVYEVRAALGRMGAPYGQYLLDDVARGRVHAKLYVLLDAWCLSARTRAALLKSMRGSARIWSYAPGWHDEYRESPESMRELTGFSLKPVEPETAWATPTAAGRKLGLTQSFGVRQEVRPLFAAADARPQEVLATYPDGSAAVALRRTPSGPSFFVSAPGLTSELLRVAARLAEAHLYTESDCCVYANGPFVAVHAGKDGSVVLNTRTGEQVSDVLTGRTIGRGPSLKMALRRGETRVLRIRR